MENITSDQENELVQELSEITQKKKALDDRLSILAVQLTHIREQKEKEQKEKEQEDENMMQALKINNPLRYANLGGRKA